jgi:methyl-accepting chemotaxis protein
MFGRLFSSAERDVVKAIHKSQAVIEFNMDGKILDANQNFLRAMGYSLSEVKGRHHSMFVEPGFEKSEEYKQFWAKLRRGEFDAHEYKRIGKNGKEVWIQAAYNPVLNAMGKPYKVVKVATDISARKLNDADTQGQIDAIGKVQAVIHFAPDGTILDANQNFLDTLGYTLEEIQGKHHSIFVEPEHANSEVYKQFWAKLRSGEYDAGEYKRICKNGKEVWILASYNPIFDMNGRLFKVVKFASDITAAKLQNADYQGQLEAIHKVQAVIEFKLDGTILTANQAFLGAMGYTLSEVQGRHHSMFVEPGEEQTDAYRAFWERLRAGQFESQVYRRYGKKGKPVWIQASYNPILDMSGKPFKVVKFATDITDLINLTEETQINVKSVAAATEEISISTREISRNMDMSREATGSIMDTSAKSGAAASSLVESMKSMEGIVNLIRDIAGRVNILALNASIEAARAGDAGKGFAVVASEVKNLANQTAEATNEIGREIGSVQTISGKVASSIADTVKGVSLVNQYVNSVATSMEEQTAVTKDISENSMRMSVAIEEIADRAKRVSR